jgi:hypothetical protein
MSGDIFTNQGSFMTLASTAMKVASSMSQGNAQAAAAAFEADQLERNSIARYAQGTREAQERLREGRIIQSNARAAMAGSGGVTDDPAALETQAEIRNATDYNALAALYNAEVDANAMSNAASARRYEGKLAKQKGMMGALSTVLKSSQTYSPTPAPSSGGEYIDQWRYHKRKW